MSIEKRFSELLEMSANIKGIQQSVEIQMTYYYQQDFVRETEQVEK